MNLQPIIATPTTIITGFLGAGKTTLLNTLITHKLSDDKWVLLINEFGKIGIDGSLITQDDDITIKEVSGGCICCTGQLPLQIALVRLLGDHKPSRLIIEPTGLAHPDELLGQLGAAHWQASLKLQAVLCVVAGTQWQQDKYRTHDGYIAHVRHADVVLCNRTDGIDVAALSAWIRAINPHAKIILDGADDDLQALLDLPHHSTLPARTVALGAPNQPANNTPADAPISLPYRYHERIGEHHVGGWRLPAEWQFDSYDLQKWLLSRPNYLRIKGIIHTTEGWLMLNIAPDGISISDTDERADSRLEMIFADQISDDTWQVWDGELMGMKS
ncbi:GTP-binding protein [Moraxella sp. FZFQ2102]|uniref:CobW family GTP-binding protein n=1 Tax=Moraxella sp. FZFQ2102 TaxID=2953752 RepID=UPI00209BC283|nr:GTP-binding protein [Moraxella sp. FZFQ2102]USZ15742.1 GTP-binding protein [Moraxella sp. FZFQ2102]